MAVLKDSDKACLWMTYSLCSAIFSADAEEVSEALEVSEAADVPHNADSVAQTSA